MSPPLAALIDRELRQTVQPGARVIAELLRTRHGEAVRAILFYGSCLRTRDAAGVLDFYVLVDDYRAFHRAVMPALFNRLLPPNVYFLRTEGAPSVAAKVAVISLRQFAARMRVQSLDTTLWARFTQPSALLYAADETARAAVIGAIEEAQRTAIAWARRFAPGAATPRALWTALFENTYGAELRAETAQRAAHLYETEPARYDAIAAGLGDLRAASGAWGLRRAAGKSLSVLRLIKAAFTFAGAADYVAFKIERHTGVPLALTPWQRRHPVLAAPALLARLYREGLIR